MKNKILAGLLALLGFSVAELGCGRVEYGMPHADFEVKGKVVDSESKDPIEGIKVFVKHEGYQDNYYEVMSAETNTAGEYSMRDKQWMYGYGSTLKVITEDIDGESNGGKFAIQTKEIELKKSDFTGGNGWYDGQAEKTVDFELKKITGDEE